MIPRRLSLLLSNQLQDYPAVGLLGPRQVGKTTLARALDLGEHTKDQAVSLDLENPADVEKLDDTAGYLDLHAERLVIFDEVQRLPGLFELLRGLIDDRIHSGNPNGHFLLLGSASIELLRQSSESLAGRIAYLELAPLDVTEVEPDQETELWIRGGFPRSFLASSDEASASWRENFIATYLERDIPQLGPRIPATTLRRFWTMLAHRQGALLNAAELARSLAVDGKTVARYLDLMVDLLLVRRLQPLHANVGKRLVRSPKTYLRDPGLVHTLLRLDTTEDVLGHPIVGGSWEGHVIENLLRVAPSRSEASFYRTSAGAEVDLVIDLPGSKRWAIEIKRGTAASVSRGFHTALGDIEPDQAFVVHSGNERYPKRHGVEAIGLRELANELLALSRSTAM